MYSFGVFALSGQGHSCEIDPLHTTSNHPVKGYETSLSNKNMAGEKNARSNKHRSNEYEYKNIPNHNTIVLYTFRLPFFLEAHLWTINCRTNGSLWPTETIFSLHQMWNAVQILIRKWTNIWGAGGVRKSVSRNIIKAMIFQLPIMFKALKRCWSSDAPSKVEVLKNGNPKGCTMNLSIWHISL